MAKEKKATRYPVFDGAPIRVRAIQPGFYGIYREAGDVFMIRDGSQFSERWMMVDSADQAEIPVEESPTATSDASGTGAQSVI